ncbi:MAG: LysM peptidoglycan-binding domain-containing protein [Candidatus Sericytochromatia bacterium]|nr:LysM peptidoglycan-binding domain-containing protein [Candidatus Sericytochromatia bacterium]
MTTVNNPASAASAPISIESNRPNPSAAAPQQPAAASPAPSALSAGDQTSFTSYTVKKGDSLWSIAGAQLGDNNQWPVLFALNKSQIKNPDLIYPGQVLTVPSKVAVAPPQQQPSLPSPVDNDPPPAAPTPAPAAPPAATSAGDEPEIQIPVQGGSPAAPAPAPASPPPAAEAPVAPAAPPAQPAEPAPQKPLLRHPDELPRPLDEPTTAPAGSLPGLDEPVSESEFLWAQDLEQRALNGYEPTQNEVDKYKNILARLEAAEAQQPGATPAPVEEAAPQPTAPAPIPAEERGLSTIGQPTAPKSNGVGKAALIGGAVGTIGMGATLIGLTSTLAPPAANLGGYATAQVVAKGVNSLTSKVGFKALPTGPAMTKLVSKVGGPKVAGSVAAVGVGLAVAGLAAGGYYLYQRATAKEEAAPQPAQQPAATPAQASAAPVPQQPEAADDDSAFANLQPVIDNNSKPPVDLSSKHAELEDLVSQKKYTFFGGATQPDQIRATGVQIWLDGNLEDRVRVANTLVNNGQSELLGRIMGHEETSKLEIAEVMSHAQFPVKEFMGNVDDNRAFLILNALSEVAVMGEGKSAQVLSDVADGYSGRFRDREAPFNRLRNQHQAVGTWNQLPADLRQKIDQLLK